MNSIHGYTLLDRIHITKHSDIYNGTRDADGLPVVINISHDEDIVQAQARIEKELAVILTLERKGIIKGVEIKQFGEHPALILERFPGDNLSQHAREKPISIDSFIDIAIQLADIIAWIHQRGIIHKDIKPANILIDTNHNEICLTDFGTAASLDLSADGQTASLQGSLPYISPEQTGRINHHLDHRSDLYSLGVTFYEILSGQLPFLKKSSLEMIHAHLALTPQAPHEFKQDIPQALSDIIMKLLSKAPENRYQTAEGLSADLESCRNQLKLKRKISAFKLARHDKPRLFLLPQKTYGRDLEKQALIKRFNKVCSGHTELALLSGATGIGKSALFNEPQRPLLEKNGHFITGKFDQSQNAIPFTGIGQAISNFVDQLLEENHSELERARSILVNETDSVSGVIFEIAPALRLLTGPQKNPDVNLSPAETQNQIKKAFSRFIALFSTKEQPLVLFLEDLQWADTSSLMLIESIVSESVRQHTQHQSLLILGSFDNNELHSHHPLKQMIARMTQISAPISQTNLAPLQLIDIENLLFDTVHADPEEIKPLAKLVARKTDKNPFFIHQFLKHLHSLGMFKFDVKKGWTWQLEKIEGAGIPDNVTGMMTAKIQHLSPEVKEILIQASIIGRRFDIATLSSVIEVEQRILVHALHTLVAEGIFSSLNGTFSFVHSVIQETAAQLIAPKKAQLIHLKVGRWSLKHRTRELNTHKVFEIVEHLNKALALIDKQEELIQIAQLNQIAGQKAIEASAWSSAEQHFNQGLSILDESCWQTHYELSFTLHLCTARANFLTGKIDAALTGYENLLLQQLTPLDASTTYERLIALYSFIDKPEKACHLGIKAQALLGRQTNINIGKIGLSLHMALAWIKFWRFTPKKILALPEETDKVWQATAKIISEMSSPAFKLNINLPLSNSLWMVANTPKYGLGPHTADQLINYAILRGPVLGNYQYAYDIAQTALEINRTYGANRWADKINFTYNIIIRHWIEPLQDCTLSIEAGISKALENGDNEIASLSSIAVSSMQLLAGEHLSTIERSAKKAIEHCHETNFLNWDLFPKSCLRLISVLQSCEPIKNYTDTALVQYFNLETALTLETKNIYPILTGHSALIYYLLRHFEQSFIGAQRLVRIMGKDIVGLPHLVDSVLFYGLAAARMLENKQAVKKRPYQQALRFALKQFKKWSRADDPKFKYPLLWLQAEKFRLKGKSTQALDFYLRAREQAHKSGYHHLRSMIEERRGTLALALKMDQEAAIWLKNARDGFQFWGAKHIAQKLDEEFPTLLNPDQNRSYSVDYTASLHLNNTTSTEQNPTTEYHPANNDPIAAIHMIEIITGQPDLDSTLEKLLTYAIQSTKAQRGALLLEEDGDLIIEATGAAGDAFSRKKQTLEESADLPFSVLQFALRTNKVVSLGDACNEGLFCKDLWVQNTKAKSILCCPITKNSGPIGVLYLENNLITDAFCSEGLALLQLIINQAANAIDHSRRNQTLQQQLSSNQENLEQTQLELSTSAASRSHLINTLAHEIRTPMTNVFAVVDLLKHTQLNEEQLEYVTVIKNSSYGFLDLFNDLLDYSRIESGDIPVNKETFSLRQSTQEVCDIIAINAQQRKLEFTLQVSPKIPEKISSSIKIVQESLLTVSNHLIDRTDTGTILVTIAYATNEHSKPLLLYKVHSSSLQITVNEQQSYFVPPQQAQKAGTRRFNKTHASLFIIKQLLFALGGNIWIESDKDKGCNIQYSIPLETIVPYNPVVIPNIEQLKLVYIEANKFAATSLQENLQALGSRLTCYNSVEDFHALNQNNLTEISILFIAYPLYQTGNKKFVRSLTKTHGVKIILVCPILEKINAKSGAQPWASEVLTKPVHSQHLIKLLLAYENNVPSTHSQSLPSDSEGLSQTTQPPPLSQALEILLVDDDKDQQILTQTLLKESGYQCTIVNSGNNAINKFKNKQWDLILMDCELPELNGLETTKIIRSIEGLEQHVAIVAMATNTPEDDKDRCLDAGMDDYLRKPLDPVALLDIINKHTEAPTPRNNS